MANATDTIDKIVTGGIEWVAKIGRFGRNKIAHRPGHECGQRMRIYYIFSFSTFWWLICICFESKRHDETFSFEMRLRQHEINDKKNHEFILFPLRLKWRQSILLRYILLEVWYAINVQELCVHSTIIVQTNFYQHFNQSNWCNERQ